MPDEVQLRQIGRLLMRVEGAWWVAYFTTASGSLNTAKRIGKIRMSVVQDEGRRQMFMDLCKSFLDEAVAQSTGKQPVWSIEDAGGMPMHRTKPWGDEGPSFDPEKE